MIDGISIREAASELGVSVQTVHNRVKSGALDGEKNEYWLAGKRTFGGGCKKTPPRKASSLARGDVSPDERSLRGDDIHLSSRNRLVRSR